MTSGESKGSLDLLKPSPQLTQQIGATPGCNVLFALRLQSTLYSLDTRRQQAGSNLMHPTTTAAATRITTFLKPFHYLAFVVMHYLAREPLHPCGSKFTPKLSSIEV